MATFDSAAQADIETGTLSRASFVGDWIKAGTSDFNITITRSSDDSYVIYFEDDHTCNVEVGFDSAGGNTLTFDWSDFGKPWGKTTLKFVYEDENTLLEVKDDSVVSSFVLAPEKSAPASLLSFQLPESPSSANSIVVLCYNILSNTYIDGYTLMDPSLMSIEVRYEHLLRQLLSHPADIMLFQEVDPLEFSRFVLGRLMEEGFDYLHIGRKSPNQQTIAILWKRDRFERLPGLKGDVEIDFDEDNGCSVVLPKGSAKISVPNPSFRTALCAAFIDRSNGYKFAVANCHIPCYLQKEVVYGTSKQIPFVKDELGRALALCRQRGIPSDQMIIAGDFNSSNSRPARKYLVVDTMSETTREDEAAIELARSKHDPRKVFGRLCDPYAEYRSCYANGPRAIPKSYQDARDTSKSDSIDCILLDLDVFAVEDIWVDMVPKGQHAREIPTTWNPSDHFPLRLRLRQHKHIEGGACVSREADIPGAGGKGGRGGRGGRGDREDRGNRGRGGRGGRGTSQ